MTNRENIINNHYTNYDEDSRLIKDNHNKIEFITTTHYIDRFLQKGMRVLEVGAGTGRYSLHYAKAGFQVHAIDFVEHNVQILKSKIENGMNITAQQGDALDLSRFDDNTFDVTLVLGPLYHLYNDNDYHQAIKEAIRVTKRNGIVAFAYLTSDSIIIDWALENQNLIKGQNTDFDKNFKIINYEEGVFSAFYISEFRELMQKHNVTFLHNVATDGIAYHIKEKIDNLSDEEFKIFVKYHLSTCERVDLQGFSNHMLYICRKN